MGVPELLKFAARSAPAALCRLPSSPHTGTHASGRGRDDSEAVSNVTPAARVAAMTFDYILVDATNAAHTVGLDAVYSLLSSPHVTARVAVVFAIDAARDRTGTARQHRQTHLLVSDLDVKVRELCLRLQRCYRARGSKRSGSEESALAHDASVRRTAVVQLPVVVMSGRDVAGEGDYKILDIQRGVIAAALAMQQQQQQAATRTHTTAQSMPTFLFVSEDSDVLCGALCGPYAHNVCIATNLHDTLLELCVLRVSHVLAYVAQSCGITCQLRRAQQQQQQQQAKAVTSGATAQHVNSTPTSNRQGDEDDDDTTTTKTKDKKDKSTGAHVTAAAAADDVVRRRKVDGPLVATGVRIELHDSDDDNDDNDDNTKATADAATATAVTSLLPRLPLVTDAAATALHDSCVDLVFLFVLVMGNGAQVPALMPGVTKVDMVSCWQAYCKAKHAARTRAPSRYDDATEHADEQDDGALHVGQTLLRVTEVALPSSPQEQRNSRADVGASAAAAATRCALTLNCSLLCDILRNMHYADAHARLVSDEERSRVLSLLSSAVEATLRYVVGCNVASGSALHDSLLDSRTLSRDTTTAAAAAAIVAAAASRTGALDGGAAAALHKTPPSLTAVLLVLQQASTHTFDLYMRGMATAPASSMHGSNSDKMSSSDNDSNTHARRMQLDVRESLVMPCAAPAATMSWAVRHGGGDGGGGNRVLSLHDILSAAAANTTTTSSLTALPRTRQHRLSIAEVLLRQQQHLDDGQQHATAQRVLLALQAVWQRSMRDALPLLLRRTQASSQSCGAQAAHGTDAPGKVHGASSDGNNNNNNNEGAAAAHRAQDVTRRREDVAARYVYSFELRRMTPILLQASPHNGSDAHTRSTAVNSSSNSNDTNNNSGDNTDEAATVAAAERARMAALGVSYDYAAALHTMTATASAAATQTTTTATIHAKQQQQQPGNKRVRPGKRERQAHMQRASVTGATAAADDTDDTTQKHKKRKHEQQQQQHTTHSVTRR